MNSCKLYAFDYNYSSVILQEGGLIIVALLRIPLLVDPVVAYAEISRKKLILSFYANCKMDYDVSAKLTQKPLKLVEIANTTIH